jgi:hypothetical protein
MHHLFNQNIIYFIFSFVNNSILFLLIHSYDSFLIIHIFMNSLNYDLLYNFLSMNLPALMKCITSNY